MVHLVGVILGLAACAILAIVVWGNEDAAVLLSLAVYGAGLLAMLGCSALYNLAGDRPRKALWRRLDHAAIFVMIAGTYTPFAVVAIGGTWGTGLLVFVWTVAAAGVVLKLLMQILEPIWATKPETAGRVRGRIETVLDWAAARNLRSGDTPARWRGHLQRLLPAHAKVAPVKHFPALPYAEIPAFMTALPQQVGTSARCLEFTILTASRTGPQSERVGQRSIYKRGPGRFHPSGLRGGAPRTPSPLVIACLRYCRLCHDPATSSSRVHAPVGQPAT
jgi:Haemolysin-III related